jgi:hypothetical protein
MQNSSDKPGAKSARKIGYRNPPEETRFKKGQSGNPNGRGKGLLNVATVFARTLREKVVVNENGQRRTITKFEAAITQFVNKAASGDVRALQILVKLSREAEMHESLSARERPTLSELDQKVMEGFLKRLQKANGVPGGNNNDHSQQ